MDLKQFICTNCGEMSDHNYTENNNFTTGCIGCLFWLIITIFVLFISPVIALVLIAIGIIIAFVTAPKKEINCCPHCKAENCLVRTGSPKGQEIFFKYYNVIEEEKEETEEKSNNFVQSNKEDNLQTLIIIVAGIIALIITCAFLYNNSQKMGNINAQTVTQLPDNTHTPTKELEEQPQKEVIDCKALEKTIWADFYENNVNYAEKEKLINKFYDHNCKHGINENENRYGSLGYFAQAVATQTDNIQEKIKYNTIAYNNFKKDPNDKHFMESLTAISIGKQYQKMGEYNKALEWFNKVWGYYETEKALGTGRMSALPEHIGDALLLNGDNEKAYQYYYEALQNFENDVRGQENYYRIKSKIDSLIMGNIDYGTISSESIQNW